MSITIPKQKSQLIIKRRKRQRHTQRERTRGKSGQERKWCERAKHSTQQRMEQKSTGKKCTRGKITDNISDAERQPMNLAAAKTGNMREK